MSQFGFFGQGGGVGGVVATSSLPWRKGVALATLLGDSTNFDSWQPIQPSEASALTAAMSAIAADHSKACAALRDAEAAGQSEVAELLRARGAQ